MNVLKIFAHKTKRLVKVVFPDGTSESGTEKQWFTDHSVDRKDCGQLLIAACGSFTALAEARARIAAAFAEWDRREADMAEWLEDDA